MTDDPDKRKEFERKWRIPEIFEGFSDVQLEKFRAYYTELIQFNGRINLISTSTEENADVIHFADCILASDMILNATQHKEIYDIGSGNGLPGIIMAIMAPDRTIVVVDKDARKMEFIKHITSRLQLTNIEFKLTRIEELPDNSIYCAVSRAFASISKAVINMRKSCASGAEYFHMKSDSWPREVAAIPSQALIYWKPSLLGDYKVPVVGSNYSVILTKKN